MFCLLSLIRVLFQLEETGHEACYEQQKQVAKDSSQSLGDRLSVSVASKLLCFASAFVVASTSVRLLLSPFCCSSISLL